MNPWGIIALSPLTPAEADNVWRPLILRCVGTCPGFTKHKYFGRVKLDPRTRQIVYACETCGKSRVCGYEGSPCGDEVKDEPDTADGRSVGA